MSGARPTICSCLSIPFDRQSLITPSSIRASAGLVLIKDARVEIQASYSCVTSMMAIDHIQLVTTCSQNRSSIRSPIASLRPSFTRSSNPLLRNRHDKPYIPQPLPKSFLLQQLQGPQGRSRISIQHSSDSFYTPHDQSQQQEEDLVVNTYERYCAYFGSLKYSRYLR